VIITARAEKIKSISVAFLYKGGGDKEPPSNHVASMPPQFAMPSPIATAVARRICGAVLLAVHVANVGAEAKLPETEKNKLAYLTAFVFAPAYKRNVTSYYSRNGGGRLT
jgi:hypothetical protein